MTWGDLLKLCIFAFWMVFWIGVVMVITMLIAVRADGANFTIVATHGPAGPYCAFPGVCRLPDGRLICVYYNGVASGHVTWADQREKCGAVAYVTSADEGRTWSKPAMLLDTDRDDRDPNISVLKDGRVILAYFQLVAGADRVLKGDGVYIAEIDGNMKASIPRKLQHDAGGGGPLRDFGGGLLMLGSYHFDQPYVIRSGDNGRTWQVFAIPNGGKHLDAETDIIRLEYAAPDSYTSDSFYAVMRGSKCNGHFSTSTDGKNWTVAKDIGFPLDCPELHRVELSGDGMESPNPRDGQDSPLITVQGLDNSRKASSGNREGPVLSKGKRPPTHSAILLTHRVPATALHYSLDECRTWHGPIVVDTVGGAYPGFVTLKDGSVLIVYYEEGKESNIRCRRFTVTTKGIQFIQEDAQ